MVLLAKRVSASAPALKLEATIGILGGGQLGRMLALAAARLGFDVAILTPEHDSPAGRVAALAAGPGSQAPVQPEPPPS